MDKEEILNNIKIDSNAVLNDELQMKEVVNNPELAVALLLDQNTNRIIVTVENNEIQLINNVKPEKYKKPNPVDI